MERLRQRQFVASTEDRLGRTIVLEADRWEHIRNHEQLDGHELAVIRAVETAELSREGNSPARKVLYARGLGPARWLAVVVEYDGVMGRVITAYPHNKEPQIAA